MIWWLEMTYYKKIVLAGQWARASFFLSKNCAYTETHSFADIYAIRDFYEVNNHCLATIL